MRGKMVFLSWTRHLMLAGVLLTLTACANNWQSVEEETPSSITAAETRAFSSVSLPLSRAVQAAEVLTGGHAYAAAFDASGAAPIYVVVVLKNGQVEEVSVSPQDGTPRVTNSNEDPLASAPAAALLSPQTNLSAAIRAAERASGGRAIDADFFDDPKGARYHIGILHHGILKRLNVDVSQLAG